MHDLHERHAATMLTGGEVGALCTTCRCSMLVGGRQPMLNPALLVAGRCFGMLQWCIQEGILSMQNTSSTTGWCPNVVVMHEMEVPVHVAWPHGRIAAVRLVAAVRLCGSAWSGGSVHAAYQQQDWVEVHVCGQSQAPRIQTALPLAGGVHGCSNPGG